MQRHVPGEQDADFPRGEIDNAVDDRGARYRDIEQAFAYRTNLVAGCTCNGKDAGAGMRWASHRST